jgi:hypothetical protein
MGLAMIKCVLGVVASCLIVGCGGADRAIDPDGHEAENKVQLAALPEVELGEVIGAVAGVPAREAPAVLERWLHEVRDGERVLAKWPRVNGQLDLERVTLASIDASIGPGSKSRCGEVTVTFHGEATLRMKLKIPSTVAQCRGLFRASRVTGAEAAPYLRAAIADGRVPDDGAPQKVVAAN